MNKYLNDPVLNLTASALRIFRWGALTIMFLALFAAAMALLALFIPSMALSSIEKISFSVMIPTALAIGYLLARFLGTLREVVLSVREGQPLTRNNASRLRTMGWLWIGLEAVVLLTSAAFGLLQLTSDAQFTADAWNFDTDAAFGLVESLLIAASLFILARVFEQGAKMQDELEGTV